MHGLKRSMLAWLMDAVVNSDPPDRPSESRGGGPDLLSYIATTAESVYCRTGSEANLEAVIY